MLRPTLALAAIAALFAAASCKSDEQSKQGNAKPTDGAAAASLQKGGMVRIPSNEPKYLNPILEPRFVPANDLIFEGLVGLDAKGDPVPRLAASWDLSADGRTITFKLRDGVKWHDGAKFTSDDVAFTLEAIRSTAAATVWKAYMAPVQTLTTPDDRTVVVTYAEAYAPALVTWTVGILPKHIFASTDGAVDLTSAHANLEPVGTGPFKYTRWELGKALYLESNKDWWQKQPHLDGIQFVFGTAEVDMLEALRRDQLDWAKIGDVDAWLSIAQTGDFHEQFETSEVVESRIRLIAWNTQRDRLSDKRVRVALTYALDRNRLITDVLFGQAQALPAPLFPTMFGHDPSVAPLPFDLDKAKALLDEAAPAKAGKRFSIELIAVETLKSPTTDSMMSIFKRDLATLGIELRLTTLPSKEYYERIARRDYDGVYFGWLPDIPDPDPAALLHSSQAQSGANFAAYSNPAVDKLIEDARRTMDRDARRKLYEQLERMLVEEMPYTPLYAPYGHYAWSRRLHGVTTKDVAPTPPLPGVAGWWLSKK
jgi:peptide/nickel transport system substrate-binding protein